MQANRTAMGPSYWHVNRPLDPSTTIADCLILHRPLRLNCGAQVTSKVPAPPTLAEKILCASFQMSVAPKACWIRSHLTAL